MSQFTVRGIMSAAPVARTGEYGDFVTFNLADNQTRRTEEGEWVQVATTWYSVLVPQGRLAEQVLAAGLDKGSLVEVEASFLKATVYTASDGSTRPSLRMTARNISIPLSKQTVKTSPRQQEEVPNLDNDAPAEQVAADAAPF